VTLSEHTLLKYLSSLEKRGIVHSRKEGNLKIYEISLNSAFVKVFFSYFDLERLHRLEYKRGTAIQVFVEKIKNIKIPYFTLLFGSTAKENYTAKSDIDLIVVYGAGEKGATKGIDSLKKQILAETGLRLNSIVMRLDEFLKERENKQNYALQDALSYGYPVFGNQLYYEIMFQ
ncbi:MAG: nucleotidyltransferase domain-containing protein, partial [Nanoarchaeota archaeon]|nr:nucleotidyltransferase domain-containing protein [Nanoarchaeota archaeon]